MSFPGYFWENLGDRSLRIGEYEMSIECGTLGTVLELNGLEEA